MAVIHVLDKHTAELIAAGEVVERPASVVKELTENAIDAGATAVSVSVERGGIAMIQIADNGCGIEAEYIPTAFIRHATSKLEKEEDLESIHTLGFRGEALASVASVSRIELLTKTDADEYAYLYRISGGEEQGIEPAARPVGTTITVRDLFYNTPARMKFLKKDTSEGNYVADVVTQLALSHPEVSFKFVRDGKPQFQTPGDGKLLGAAYAVLSRDFAKDLVPVEHTAGSYTVRGLVTPPKSARASRAMQYFFINGRFVKNRTMMAALEAAYKGVMMQGKFPGCVLSIEMPPQLVDVNVHPAKTEVRFAREKDVFDAVYQSVKCVLITPQSTEKVFSFGGAERAFPADEKAPDAAAKKEPSESAPAEEPAGGGGTQRVGLLIALVPDVLPDVAPGREAVGDVGLHGYHQEARHGRAGDREEHGGEAARAHEGDDKEGRKEDDRRAEVADERQGYDADGGEHDEHKEVPPREEPVERRRAGVDVEHLDELGGLEADARDAQPVLGAEHGLAEHDVHGQQSQRRRRGYKARGLDALEAPKPGAEEEVERDAEDDEDGLAEHVLRRGRGADRRAQRREEKGQRLRLKARAAHAARHEIAEPLQDDKRQES